MRGSRSSAFLYLQRKQKCWSRIYTLEIVMPIPHQQFNSCALKKPKEYTALTQSLSPHLIPIWTLCANLLKIPINKKMENNKRCLTQRQLLRRTTVIYYWIVTSQEQGLELPCCSYQCQTQVGCWTNGSEQPLKGKDNSSFWKRFSFSIYIPFVWCVHTFLKIGN